jgi:outer membrane protein assembly factor BamB
MKKTILVLLVCFFILGSSLDLSSQEWSQFRGYDRSGKVTGFKAPSKWPAEITPSWKIKVGTGDASPVLSGKKIYIHTRQGTDETIICLDAKTGKDIWNYKYAAPAVTGPSGSHPGPRSTPVVSNNKIITYGVSGIVNCLDAATGKLIWKKDDPSFPVLQFFTSMSPLVTDGKCIIQMGGKDTGKVVAFDLNTGEEKWAYTGEGPSYASPSIMTFGKVKSIVIFLEKSLVALNVSDGRLLWQVPAIPGQRYYNCVSPYIDGNKIYYSGQGTGSKAIAVSKDGDQFITSELWSNPLVGAKWNTPVLKNGYLYGFSDQRRIYCLNASTGQTAWIDNATNSDFATLVDCGSVLIGFPATGNLIVLKPDPVAYTEIAKYKVADTQVYTFPVISGNKVYVKDSENLIMYLIK